VKRLKTSIAAWSALVAVLAFALASSLLPPDGVRNISYALVTGVTAAGIIRWLPDALRAFRSGRAGADFLMVGVCSLLTALFFHRVWVMSITYVPGINLDLVTYFMVWMLAWACSLILVAPDVEDGVIRSRSFVLIGLALFIAGVMSGISIGLSLG